IADLTPDGTVNALRISRRWPVDVDYQQVNTGSQGDRGFLDEVPQRVPAGLVPRRDDLDHGHDTIPTGVPDDEHLALPGVIVHLGSRLGMTLWRGQGQGRGAGWVLFFLRKRRGL